MNSLLGTLACRDLSMPRAISLIGCPGRWLSFDTNLLTGRPAPCRDQVDARGHSPAGPSPISFRLCISMVQCMRLVDGAIFFYSSAQWRDESFYSGADPEFVAPLRPDIRNAASRQKKGGGGTVISNSKTEKKERNLLLAGDRPLRTPLLRHWLYAALEINSSYLPL